MKLFTSLLLAGSFASAAATPRNPLPSGLGRRQQIDNYYINLYENTNYGGRLARIQAAWDICYTIIQQENNWASSAKPDALGGGKCTLYENDRCQGANILVTSAGITDLGSVNLDNKVSSFRCGG